MTDINQLVTEEVSDKTKHKLAGGAGAAGLIGAAGYAPAADGHSLIWQAGHKASGAVGKAVNAKVWNNLSDQGQTDHIVGLAKKSPGFARAFAKTDGQLRIPFTSDVGQTAANITGYGVGAAGLGAAGYGGYKAGKYAYKKIKDWQARKK